MRHLYRIDEKEFIFTSSNGQATTLVLGSGMSTLGLVSFYPRGLTLKDPPTEVQWNLFLQPKMHSI